MNDAFALTVFGAIVICGGWLIGWVLLYLWRGMQRYYRDNRPMATRLGKPDPRCARNPPTNKHGRVE